MGYNKVLRKPHTSYFSGVKLGHHERLNRLLFLIAIISLPFSAQGVDAAGLKLQIAYVGALLFSLVYFWDIPPRQVDLQDQIYLGFLYVAVISLAYNQLLGRVANTASLGEGLRFSLRQLVHLARYILFYFIYKAFKEFFVADDWKHRQELFCKAMVAAAWIPAIYGTYQFFAQRFDWPLANINNLHAVGARLSVHYLDDLRGSFYTIFATFGETKTYAGFLLGVVPILIGIMLVTRKSRRFLLDLSTKRIVVLIGMLIAHFFLGFSRTGYVGFALLMVFVLVFINRKAAIGSGAVFLVFLTVFSLFSTQSPFLLIEELWFSLWDPMSTGGVIIARWKFALQETAESPILGYGLGNTYDTTISVARTSRVTEWFAAPGLLGQLLPGVGALGTLLFLAFLGSHVWLSLSNLSQLDKEEGIRALLLFSLLAVVGSWAIRFIHLHANATLPWITLAENAALNHIVSGNAQKHENVGGNI